MLARYDQYHHLEPELEEFISRINELVYRNYASDMLRNLLRSSDFDMEESVKRAIAIFNLTGIPVRNHISGIYRSYHGGIRKDWRLSELACSLVILTSYSPNSKVRDIQNELLRLYGLLNQT